MPDRFRHSDLTRIAREFGGSPAAVERMCGRVRARVDEREFLLGLDLLSSDFFLGKSRDEVALQAVHLLVEYRAKCPKVCQWLARGDFNPHKVPDTLTAGELLHASRTGQRLRAESLRRSASQGYTNDPGE